MKRNPGIASRLALSSIACVALVALAFGYLDVPIARALWRSSHLLKPLSDPFGAAILLSGEAAVLVALGAARLARGKASPFQSTLGLACLASIAAYLLNDFGLKVLFGVPGPAALLHGAGHGLHFGAGSAGSSFPSGHMVLASGFAGVFMARYPASVRPLVALLVAGAVLLLAGDWHFLSDIIAGAFVGLWAGMLAATAHGSTFHSRRGNDLTSE